MIYLVTGANGAGKTLNTLKWVRELSLRDSRPVYYNGRFEMTADFGWLKFEFSDWQSLPDGSILLVDECHNDMPVRGNAAAVPEAIRMLAEHRRRGFDFFLITQHPQNIDLFVRRLIGPPGWHRHLKRTFGVDMVSCLEWSAVNAGCERPASGKDAKISMIPFPKDVYGWYKSAMLHTGKKSIPKQVYFLGVAFVVIPVLFYFVFQKLAPEPPIPASILPGSKPVLAAPSSSRSGAEKPVLSPAEYSQSFVPRVDGFPGSASRYDSVSAPTQAPKPAACIQGFKPGGTVMICECWTQQATRLSVPPHMCTQIVRYGWFDDTLQRVDSKVDAPLPSKFSPVLPLASTVVGMQAPRSAASK